MMTDHVAEAVAGLQAAEAELKAELVRVRRALDALGVGASSREQSAVHPETDTDSVERPTKRDSVAARVVALLDEEPRGWSAAEIAEEYELRGNPVHVEGRDRTARVRTALHNAVKNGRARKLEDGRYISTRGQLNRPLGGHDFSMRSFQSAQAPEREGEPQLE